MYRKIQDQIEAFKQEGLDICTIETFPKERTAMKKKLATLPFTPIGSNWKIDVPEGMDFAYIRHFFCDRFFIAFLKKFRRENPKCKIILEFHDYPYDKGLLNPKQFMFLIKDKLHRNKMKKYINRIATLTDDKEIFGIKTLYFVNGLNVAAIKPRIPVNNGDDAIHLIAVAYFGSWHGYDRLLMGLGEYYKNGGERKIVFHMVGRGRPLKKYPQYEDIIKDYALHDNVVMHGELHGEDLEKVYSISRVAISALAFHRVDMPGGPNIKSREYLSKGIPILHGGIMNGIEDSFKYLLCVKLAETPIDIIKVISFYDDIYVRSGKSEQQIIDEIRTKAYEVADTRKNMREIFDYINS